jgi:hypothetical protein
LATLSRLIQRLLAMPLASAMQSISPDPAGRPVPWWLTAAALLAWVVAAAKAHGRQVRIEREQQGVFHVDFGGQNPASVERIWRQDRRLFWPCFALLALLLAGAALLAGDALRLAYSFPAAFAFAFMAAGAASWIRMGRRKKGPLPWRRRAWWGSVAWWSLAAALAVLSLWSLTD